MTLQGTYSETFPSKSDLSNL